MAATVKGVSVMSGYRDTSNFDPTASPRYGKPLRPYNWVQWTGVAMALIGIAMDIFYFAGRFGWTSRVISPAFALPPIFLGISLINSRREEIVDPAPELAAARRRWMLITIAILVVIFGAALIIDFKGA